MSRVEDRPHLLVVTVIPEDEEFERTVEYELFHPLECKQETWEDPVAFGESLCFDEGAHSYTYYTCHTGAEVEAVGLEDVEGWEDLDSGNYLIRAWSETFNTWHSGREYDAGLDLIGSATEPLDTDQRQGLDDRR